MAYDKNRDQSANLVIVYLAYMVFCTIGFAVIGGAAIFLISGCWPVSSIGISPCLAVVIPGYTAFVPAVLGVAAGALLARRTTK